MASILYKKTDDGIDKVRIEAHDVPRHLDMGYVGCSTGEAKKPKAKPKAKSEAKKPVED